ncbi:MAG: AAA family ATPase [Candidatus Babeliaceae bacterium]|nr:AAA family ATPase [Candidatus Babeliaceae bacterium]
MKQSFILLSLLFIVGSPARGEMQISNNDKISLPVKTQLQRALMNAALFAGYGTFYRFLEKQTNEQVPFLLSAAIGFCLPNEQTIATVVGKRTILKSLLSAFATSIICKLLFSEKKFSWPNHDDCQLNYQEFKGDSADDLKKQKVLKERLKKEYPELQNYFDMLSNDEIGTLTLLGPTGAGKTTFVRKLAKAYGRPLIEADAAELVDIYVHSTSSKTTSFLTKIDKLIEVGKLPRGSIVFIDEVHELIGTDSVSIHHSNADESYAFKRLIETITRKGLLFICATNKSVEEFRDINKRRLLDRLYINGQTFPSKEGIIITLGLPDEEKAKAVFSHTFTDHFDELQKIWKKSNAAVSINFDKQQLQIITTKVAQNTSNSCALWVIANIASTLAEAVNNYVLQELKKENITSVSINVPDEFVNLLIISHLKEMNKSLESKSMQKISRLGDDPLSTLLNNQSKEEKKDTQIKKIKKNIENLKKEVKINEEMVEKSTNSFIIANKHIYKKHIMNTKE